MIVRTGFGMGYYDYLVAEFISPQKVYTFSFIVDNTIPKSVHFQSYSG